ncbi:hypothetical protein P1P75_03665 [Streptomyces sp. ID05-39B]|uniref:hypothetical protein n=1 Tax=Streptomyces sp. ID05-39B TaxID=3028664 RepID=UPI0029A7D14F|nr:hypothetical protein [Streptomyces sp. ID05-39B]MDX3525551.1 hypothetical protein [Streptomyces sp. ID05-39B]
MSAPFDRELEQAINAATAHELRLLNVPGVVKVGAGPQRTGGVLTGRAAVVVTVRAKRSPQELQALGLTPLPRELNGVPVDVMEEHVPQEAPEIVQAHDAAAQVLDRVRDEWLREPNVTGIGVAYKKTGGQTDYQRLALTVFVAQKVAPDEVRRWGWREVPSEIDGIHTDVEELPPPRPTTDASGSRGDRKDPLLGGITVGVNTRPFSWGTLGAVVFDRNTNEQLVLSNQHVLDGTSGTEVVQPSPISLDDSLEIGFQFNACNPIDFFRLDTPNTTLGSVLAGAAVSAALAAAMSDEIDPTRRGQEATWPPEGAHTRGESHSVALTYPEMPIPGTHFEIGATWSYARHTTEGDLTYEADDLRTNPHVLEDQLLLTDRSRYRAGDTVRLYGLILPEKCAWHGGDETQVTEADLATWTAALPPPAPLPPATSRSAVRQQRHAPSTCPRQDGCRSDRGLSLRQFPCNGPVDAGRR